MRRAPFADGSTGAHNAEAHSLEEGFGYVEGVDLVGLVHHRRLDVSLRHVRLARREASADRVRSGESGERWMRSFGEV